MNDATDRLAAAIRDVLAEVVAAALPGSTPSLPVADLTVTHLAERFNRTANAVRAWLDAGRFPGAYKLRGREWRVPIAALAAFEDAERSAHPTSPTPAHKKLSLSAWRQHQPARQAKRRRRA